MDTLPHRYLATLTLDVDFASIARVGATRAGSRGIAPVTGGRCEGDRLSGTVTGGRDWFVTRHDGTLAIDVRLTLSTDDGATMYVRYEGHMVAEPDVIERFRCGERLTPGEYRLETVVRFESGDERYSWLNDRIAVAIGEQSRGGPVYRVYTVGV